MKLTDTDVKRAAKAILHEHGPGSADSVRVYAVLLRRDARNDLAEEWDRVAEYLDALELNTTH
jgi:hypothetical protein